MVIVEPQRIRELTLGEILRPGEVEVRGTSEQIDALRQRMEELVNRPHRSKASRRRSHRGSRR
jgi:hypothetical protein